MPFSIKNMIETMAANEKDSGNYLKTYGSKLSSPGLKKLLMSIAQQEKEHEMELRELLTGTSLSDSFSENIGAEIRPALFTDISSKKTNLTAGEMLSFLLKYFKAMAALYAALARAAFDAQLQILFKRLAEEETKILHWVQDRYDLEALQ
jgi:rubrerythrin